MVTQGSRCIVTHQIVINGQVAFMAGEKVTVDKVQPNPQRPDYQYVVFSSRFQKRFQLSDADLR